MGYAIGWSEEDREYVGTHSDCPSLSHMDRDPRRALEGIMALVEGEALPPAYARLVRSGAVLGDPTTPPLAHDPGRAADDLAAWVTFMAAALQSQKVVKVGECMVGEPPSVDEAVRIADAALLAFRARWEGR